MITTIHALNLKDSVPLKMNLNDLNDIGYEESVEKIEKNKKSNIPQILNRAQTSPHNKNRKNSKQPNIIKRNKSMKYSKIPAAKQKSSFGTTSTGRENVSASSLPGPGSYDAGLSTFKSQSPKLNKCKSTTFGISTKATAAIVKKTSKLGPGAYESPKNIIKGGSFGKATRKVSTLIDVKNKISSVSSSGDHGNTKAIKPLFTADDFENAEFDWRWYRDQYHKMIINDEQSVPKLSSPKVSSPKSNFGNSPRFDDKSANPVCLASFKGSRAASVKQIL